jgi:HSP20 family protein
MNISSNSPSKSNMKVKKILSALTLLIVALCNIHFIASIPQSKATRYNCGMGIGRGNHWPCPAVQRHGRRECNLSTRRRDPFDQLIDLFTIPTRFNSMLQKDYHPYQQEKQSPQSLSLSRRSSSSPRYEMREDESKMELRVDVPGIDASDINIQLEKGDKVLNIKGLRRYNLHNQGTRSEEFEQRFTIDPNTVEIKKLQANLAEGVLTISVPKKVKQPKIEDKPKTIPVVTADVKVNHYENVPVKEVTKKIKDDDLEITEEDI